MSQPFDPADYPHGCRCSCCHREFKDGDVLVHREVGELAGLPCDTPVCSSCVDEPLAPDHPMLAGETVVMRADGRVS